MSRRVIIVHGLEASPDDNWFPWLKEELEARQYYVLIPAMPHPAAPQVDDWTRKLHETVGLVDQETYFVGHSLGCLGILLYLQTLKENEMVGRCIFVAGFSGNLNNPNTRAFHEYSLELNLVKNHIHRIVAILNKDDPRVPFDIASDFAKQLGAKILVTEGKGHFRESDGVKELPLVLNEILVF